MFFAAGCRWTVPLTAGLHDAAFALAEAVYTGTRLARALEKVFAAMAAHAVHLQLQCGALGSEDAMLLGGSSGGQAAQRGDGQEATIPQPRAQRRGSSSRSTCKGQCAMVVAGERRWIGCLPVINRGRVCLGADLTASSSSRPSSLLLLRPPCQGTRGSISPSGSQPHSR